MMLPMKLTVSCIPNFIRSAAILIFCYAGTGERRYRSIYQRQFTDIEGIERTNTIQTYMFSRDDRLGSV